MVKKHPTRTAPYTRLSVNLNKIALLRNSRHTGVPNVVQFADLAIESGAHGITLHPRSDERHVRKSDVLEVAKRMKSVRPRVELNIEGYPDERFLRIIDSIKSEQCTLVPDAPSAFTSDTGWKFTEEYQLLLRAACKRLKKTGTRIILFVDPGFTDIEKIHAVGADGIEIYTGEYASAYNTKRESVELKKILTTAKKAWARGLQVHIGHDLNLKNLPPLVTAVGPYISEASIGHEFTADALVYGFKETVKKYLGALNPTPTSIATSNTSDPYKHFRDWFEKATSESQPNAMILATADTHAHPSSRIVFLRDFSRRGFTFFTNYKSRKGMELEKNPHAAILFYWQSAGRQVRITGNVEKTSLKESTTYFKTRPRDNQISAWASSQSAELPHPEILERTMKAFKRKYAGKNIPLPPHWGGYRVIPEQIEFWENGGAGRLHSRTQYVQNKGRWEKRLLFP